MGCRYLGVDLLYKRDLFGYVLPCATSAGDEEDFDVLVHRHGVVHGH